MPTGRLYTLWIEPRNSGQSLRHNKTQPFPSAGGMRGRRGEDIGEGQAGLGDDFRVGGQPAEEGQPQGLPGVDPQALGGRVLRHHLAVHILGGLPGEEGVADRQSDRHTVSPERETGGQTDRHTHTQ